MSNEQMNNSEPEVSEEQLKSNIFDNRHAYRIIFILLLAGLISGVRNVLKEEVHGNLFIEQIGLGSWSYHIISAIVAACLVPLFLHFIHSDLVLIDKTNENNIRNNMKAFILFGFCLIAGSFSDNFIEGLYSNSIQNEINELVEEKNKEKDFILSDLLNKINNPLSLTEKESYLKYLQKEFGLEKDDAKIVLEIKEKTPITRENLFNISSDSSNQTKELLEKMIKKGVFVEINLKKMPTIVTRENFEGN